VLLQSPFLDLIIPADEAAEAALAAEAAAEPFRCSAPAPLKLLSAPLELPPKLFRRRRRFSRVRLQRRTRSEMTIIMMVSRRPTATTNAIKYSVRKRSSTTS
jgi:hypothetical protein